MEVEKLKDKDLSKPKQGKKVIKRVKKVIKRSKKKAKTPPTKTAETGTPIVLPSPVDPISYDIELVIKNRGVLDSKGLYVHSGTKRKQIAKKKVVVTSSEEDVYIISSTQNSLVNKRVTRSMLKEKDTEVRIETSPIVLDDSPKKASPEPSPDFFWDTKILHTTNYLTPTEPCHEVPSQRPVTPPLPTGIGMDFPPPPPTRT